MASVGLLTICAPAGASTPSCGGEVPLAKSTGAPWTCSFDDEFDATTGDAGSLNTSVWVPQVSATSGFTTGQYPYAACYVNSPNNISVSGGALHLTVRKEAAPVNCGYFSTQFTGGMVSTANSFSQTYGRFEVRALLPQTTAAGLQETLWLWPVSQRYGSTWPASGEVDLSEFYSSYATLDIPYLHYNYNWWTANQTTHTNVVTAYCNIDYTRYNDYAVVWSPGSFAITINGKTCLVDNYVPSGGLVSPQPFDQPFFVLLTQALGMGSNAYNPNSTPLPATTSVDYVRVWK